MVSGLVTSPCDQLRIFSGEARLMRMASKSVTEFPRSNGLERYKVSSNAMVTPPLTAPAQVINQMPALANAGAQLQSSIARADRIAAVRANVSSRRRRLLLASC